MASSRKLDTPHLAKFDLEAEKGLPFGGKINKQERKSSVVRPEGFVTRRFFEFFQRTLLSKGGFQPEQ